MSNPILFLNQPYVQVGLGTLAFTIPSDGLYNVAAQVTVPTAVATGYGAGSAGSDSNLGPVIQSGVTVQVKQNGSTKFTSSTLGVQQGAFQFKADLVCTAADAITIVIASSTTSDQQLSGVSSVVSVNQGI